MFQTMLIYMITLNSMMFYYSKTPISMGTCLLTQTMLMSLLSGMMSVSFWYTYIMCLIMIGGVLVLFIYTSNLAPNQKFSFNKNKFLLLNFIIFLVIFIFTKKMNFYSSFNFDSMNIMNLSLEENFELKMSLNTLYNKPGNLTMMMVINYLLLTLFTIVEIININMGPLRKNI